MSSLRSSLSGATEAYLDARGRWNETRARVDATQARLTRTRLRQTHTQKLLANRMRILYRDPGVELVDVVLGSADFQELVTMLDYISRVGEADAELILELKRLKRQLAADKRQLRRLETEQRVRVRELKSRADKLEAQLEAQKEMYARLRRAAMVEAQASSARGGGPTVVISASGDWVFPVAGPHSYSNDWGNPRSGGRSHKGCDIFAPFGTPVVAVVAGHVTTRSGGLGGLAIWLSGSDGNEYYYAHLQGFAVGGGSVSKGQVIGYVGNTGNASGGAPHLHFEIHPGGGPAVNPYPTLVAHD